MFKSKIVTLAKISMGGKLIPNVLGPKEFYHLITDLSLLTRAQSAQEFKARALPHLTTPDGKPIGLFGNLTIYDKEGNIDKQQTSAMLTHHASGQNITGISFSEQIGIYTFLSLMSGKPILLANPQNIPNDYKHVPPSIVSDEGGIQDMGGAEIVGAMEKEMTVDLLPLTAVIGHVTLSPNLSKDFLKVVINPEFYYVDLDDTHLPEQVRDLHEEYCCDLIKAKKSPDKIELKKGATKTFLEMQSIYQAYQLKRLQDVNAPEEQLAKIKELVDKLPQKASQVYSKPKL
ncbi:MAG: hypothetical protein JO149_08820 [Gammaproteobacteria bacterium]|nr:hypothetical protein [Gammaproteobacteria bacterium]